MKEYMFVADEGDRCYLAETMEFASALLDDEKVFCAMVGGELLKELREGKNILVISPKNAQSRGNDG